MERPPELDRDCFNRHRRGGKHLGCRPRLADRVRLENATVAEFGRIYADLAPSRKLSSEQIKKLAASFQTRIDFAGMDGYSLSAAEITAAMVAWTLADEEARRPGIGVRRVLAPHSQGKTNPRKVHLTRDDWLDACRWLRRAED